MRVKRAIDHGYRAFCLTVDTAVSLTVLAHLADGTVQDVTNDATWATSAPTVAWQVSTAIAASIE